MLVLKNFHYGYPFGFCPVILGDEYHKSVTLKLTDSMKYDIDSDQSDVNKLFGVSYGYHHYQSDRIGWKYKDGFIEFSLYSYELGEVRKRFVDKFLLEINLGTKVKINLNVYLFNEQRRVNVSVNSTTYDTSFKYEPKTFGYTLGFYFGGNRVAPHTIKIDSSNSLI